MTLVKVAAALLGSLGMSAAVYAVPQHVHESPTVPAIAATARTPGQRWAPDITLRTGMRRAHAAVEALRHYEMGHMSAPMAMGRVDDVEAAVTYMFTHCELPTEPDAALHGILVPLLGAAQALKAEPTDVGAVARMRVALAHYPQYFDDPGWDDPALAAPGMADQP